MWQLCRSGLGNTIICNYKVKRGCFFYRHKNGFWADDEKDDDPFIIQNLLKLLNASFIT